MEKEISKETVTDISGSKNEYKSGLGDFEPVTLTTTPFHIRILCFPRCNNFKTSCVPYETDQAFVDSHEHFIVESDSGSCRFLCEAKVEDGYHAFVIEIHLDEIFLIATYHDDEEILHQFGPAKIRAEGDYMLACCLLRKNIDWDPNEGPAEYEIVDD